MRRNDFLLSLGALAAAGALPSRVRADARLKILIPANPAGGWDTTGRELGKGILEAGAAQSIAYDNKGGGAGIIGLAHFINSARGDPDALMVMGAVMLGGIIIGKPPVDLQVCTPIARLTSEYNVFVLPGNSRFAALKDVIAQFKKDPGSIKWGGGSRGSTEHIAACVLARAVGVDPRKVNYVAFRGGGEATAAVLGGEVTVGGSGYGEFAEHINSGKMKPIGVTSKERLPGIDVPTLVEQGYDVVLGNWRGVYGPPAITAIQRAALTDDVVKATRTRAWKEALRRNVWMPALLTGKPFDDFVGQEFSSLRATMQASGMI